MSRNTWAAGVATIAVVAVIILGLRVLGGPGRQRLIQADLRTVQTLGALAQQIQTTWNISGKVLPPNLDKFPDSVQQNPATKKSFVYHPKSASAYELCATFATDTRDLPTQNAVESWAHPKGDYCFQLDVLQPVPQIPYFY
jgi:hypothetical protein